MILRYFLQINIRYFFMIVNCILFSAFSQKIDNDQDKKWFRIGIFSRSIKKYEDSIESFNKTIRLYSLISQTLSIKEQSLYALGRHKESEKYRSEKIENDDQLGVVLENKGYTLYQLEKYEEALDCFNIVIQMRGLQDLLERRDDIINKLNQSK